MSDFDDDDFDLGDLDADDDDFLGLDGDTAFDLDGDGGFFLGEASKALNAALADLSTIPSPKPAASAAPSAAAAKEATALAASAVASSGGGDNFLSKLLADREAELTTIREGGASGFGVGDGALARKKSTLEAVANSVRGMAHLSLKRGADSGPSNVSPPLGPMSRGGSSMDLLDATVAGKGMGGGGASAVSFSLAGAAGGGDEAITDDEYMELGLGRAKLKLLLQRFVRDYREALAGGGQLRRAEGSDAALKPLSVVDGTPLVLGEFERLVVGPKDGIGSSPLLGASSHGSRGLASITGSAKGRTLASIKQTLRDVSSAQEARVGRIKSLVQDGEGGLTDPMFVLPLTTRGFILPVRAATAPASLSAASASPLRPPAAATALSAEGRARALYPSSAEESDDPFGSSSSLSLAADSDEEAEREREKDQKRQRRLSREQKRRDAVIEFRREAILGPSHASVDPSSPLGSTVRGGGGDSSPIVPGLGETGHGVRATLESLGFGDPHAPPSSGDESEDLRGMAYAFLEQLLIIHEEAVAAMVGAEDYVKVPLKSHQQGTASPLRRAGLGPKADDFVGAMDAALQQGWEILFLCLGAAREVPMADAPLPPTLRHVLDRFLFEWRGTYQLTCLFALKFTIALNTRMGVEFCGKVLRHAECFQSNTIETAMVCVAEEALDGTLTDAVVWIGPILAVMRMLADSPAGVSGDLLVLALDVLMFAVLGGGNAAMQFVAEGGLAALADVLLAIDPLEIKPDVTKRILKLLNPTSLGVKPHAFLGLPNGGAGNSRRASASVKASTPSPLVGEVRPASDSAAPPRRPEGTSAGDDKPTAAEGYAFPTEGAAAGAEADPPPLTSLQLGGVKMVSSSSGDDLTKELMALAAEGEAGGDGSPSRGGGMGRRISAAADLVVLTDEDYAEIIRALEIAMEKYDGQNDERNRQAQKEAAETKAEAQRHRQAEAQTRAVRRTGGPDFNALPSARSRGSFDGDDSAPPSSSALLGPSTADNQVLDECTFIVYAIMMVNIDVAVHEGVMQLLARHVIGSDVFWNNKQTMRGVLGCVQTLLTNYSAYEAHESRGASLGMGGIGGGHSSGHADASILEASTISVSSNTQHRMSRRLPAARDGSAASRGGPNGLAYYRVIMDPPTLAVLSLAVRCFSDVEIGQLPHVTQAYKALYVLASAEPARHMLVSGCPDMEVDDEGSLIANGPPSPQPTLQRFGSMRKRVSITLPSEGAGSPAPHGMSRRMSFSRHSPAIAAAADGSPPPLAGPRSAATTSGGEAASTPPYNALIPCLLYTLTRTPFMHQKRYTISLLNKIIRGAYRPACTQLLGALPVGIIFQPPLHQGRRSRHSIAFRAQRGDGGQGGGGSSNNLAILAAHSAGLSYGGATSPQQGAKQRPGLGGISSGAIATRVEAAGAFLRFIAKFVGTAAPELIPPLLALVREVARFLAHGSSGEVFDQHLVHTILRSIVSIVQSYDQEVPVVAGGCMALGHLCRIPHTQQSFQVSRFGNSFRSTANSDAANASVLEEDKDKDKAAKATREGDAEKGSPVRVPSAAEFVVSSNPPPMLSLSPPQAATRIVLDRPTPTLSFALENESLLDMAIGFINGTFIVSGGPNNSAAATTADNNERSSGALSRRPSMQRVWRGEASANTATHAAPLSPLGPSPVVRRTLAFLLAVIAADPDAAQSIADEGGLALLQEAGGVRAATSATTPMRGGGGAGALAASSLVSPDRLLARQASMVARQRGADDALAALLTREERDLCKRQFQRLRSSATRRCGPAASARPPNPPLCSTSSPPAGRR